MKLILWNITKNFNFFIIYKIFINNFFFITLNFNNDIQIYLKNNLNLLLIFNFFKYNNLFYYKTILDLCVIDYFFNKNRFKINYNLNNFFYYNKIFINYFLSNNFSFTNSLNNLFLSLIWLEREVWDMYGIFFLNNINLKRILTDYGFKGFPLRKDFPLIGYLEIYYNNLLGEILYKPVELNQEYRFYNLDSNWNF